MVPSEFSAFFAASAGVAGALIGLLFVAMSVAPQIEGQEQGIELTLRAGVAFSALTDALVVALFALIPGTTLGVPALVVALAAVASCIALGILLVRAHDVANRGRTLRLLGLQALVFVYQAIVAVQLVHSPHSQGTVRTLAVLTVVFFLIGIARAWQMIGARETGLVRVLRDSIGDRTGERDITARGG